MKLRIFWKEWSGLFHKLIALTASVASLIGLITTFAPPPTFPWWAVALIISAFFFLAVLVYLEFATHAKRRVYAKADQDGIRKYMHDWIEHGGRVAIWTRDISWGQNPGMLSLLRAKAERRELIICLPQHNDLTRTLAEAGAEVCTFGEERLESPTSRFTIAFFERAGTRVAVGRADHDTHVIEEFDPVSHPAFYMATDLIRLARNLSGTVPAK